MSGQKKYTTNSIAKECGTYPNVIYRMKKLGILDPKMGKDGKYVYTEKHIPIIMKFIKEKY